MILKYEGKKIEKNNNDEGKMYIFKNMQAAMNDDQKLFSHIVVDGQEVYEGFEQYIDQNIHNIGEIQIVTFTLKEYVFNMFETLSQYIEKAVPLVEQMAENAYSGEEEISFNSITDLGESIQWMNQLEANLNQLNLDLIDLSEFTNNITLLNESLAEIADAMEGNDQLMLADVLSHEIVPSLNNIQEIAQATLKKERMN